MEKETNAATLSLLEAMYKNVRMGADSILDIMPKVANEKLRAELTSELERYGEFSKEIENAFLDAGEKVKDEGMLAKIGTKMSVAMNTMIDSTTSHIAEMMIQGGTMGITDATKLLREYENTSCSEEALDLARRIIQYEEETVERLKEFL
jgi:N-methylhydantoinase B/oxoprolinase/acetone carboxylase alpha subunit